MKNVLELIDEYIELQERPALFSLPYHMKTTSFTLQAPYVRYMKPIEIRCAVCAYRALPGSSYCSHHFALSCKVPKCAFFNCDEPALGGMYVDAIGLSYCYLHQSNQEPNDGIELVDGREVQESERYSIGFDHVGRYSEFEKVTISLDSAEQLVQSWMYQLVMKIKLD